MKNVKKIFNTLIGAIYPKKCIACGDIVNEDVVICDICNNKIERVNLDDVCISCGFEKNDCVCKYNIFRFNGVVCPLKNQGVARRAYYQYKFAKKQHYVDFFANEIYNAVVSCYDDVKFDLVCSVPSFKKRAYDHSRYIAESVSRKLGLPTDFSLLRCIKKTKKQHKSTIKERLVNVEGKYAANHRVDGKKILLIDDIKTTGATLDECAKILLFAGADSVFCATALGAIKSEKQKN